jgi:hypothetical protein
MNQEQIIRKRDKLLARLPEARDILRGSLLNRINHHGAGCKQCAAGDGHAVSVLAIGYPGHMRHISLRKPQVDHVKQCLKNFYALKAALEEICELNQQLLRAEPAAAEKKRRGK